MVVRRKNDAFMEIREKIIQRLKMWGNRNFSIGGKEVFIKSILQAIAIYAMQCFLLPVSFWKDIESFLCRFWWRNIKTGKGIHYCPWNILSTQKAYWGFILETSHFLIKPY